MEAIPVKGLGLLLPVNRAILFKPRLWATRHTR
jgi:hypothetical protein